MFCLFLFKQKTAYGMRISDWSSDVCSSDLRAPRRAIGPIFDIPAIVPRQRDMIPAQWRDVARDLVGRAAVSQRHFEIASVPRSEERRVGKECVSTCRSRWSPCHSKNKRQITNRLKTENKKSKN